MIAIDYVGLGGLIASAGTAIIGVIVAWRQNGVQNNVQQVHDQIQVKGAETLGELVDHVHDVACTETPPAAVKP